MSEFTKCDGCGSQTMGLLHRGQWHTEWRCQECARHVEYGMGQERVMNKGTAVLLEEIRQLRYLQEKAAAGSKA